MVDNLAPRNRDRRQAASTGRQLFYGLCLGFALIAAFGVVKFLKVSKAIAEGMAQQQPPETVTTFVARSEQWPVTFETIANITPVSGAVLAVEEVGKVAGIYFESGVKVEKGALLVALDTSVEEAALRGARADAALASVTLKRQSQLDAAAANSRAEYDEARATFDRAAAAVARLEAEIARKKVIAPFSGFAGIRKVNVGQVLVPGSPVVALESYQPLYLNFSVPQRMLSDFAVGSTLTFTVDGMGNTKFFGTVSAIDSGVEAATRQIAVQAILPNEDSRLRPGMYARVALSLSRVDSVVTVPVSSIQFAPYGNIAYLVEERSNDKGEKYNGVKQQLLQVGRKRGNLVAVTRGLKDGDTVVSSGTFKLRPDVVVVINNDTLPAADIAPAPADT